MVLHILTTQAVGASGSHGLRGTARVTLERERTDAERTQDERIRSKTLTLERPERRIKMMTKH